VTALTSTRNPRVAQVVSLHRSRGRREQRRHLVEGPHAVQEAAGAGLVDEVFVTEGLRHDLELPPDVAVTSVAEHVMERMSDARTPQGVVAVARTPNTTLDAVVGEGLLVVLFEVADPGNVGTIVRTAEARRAGARAAAPPPPRPA
jgi:RNA methyltransferase, TrmH family